MTTLQKYLKQAVPAQQLQLDLVKDWTAETQHMQCSGQWQLHA